MSTIPSVRALAAEALQESAREPRQTQRRTVEDGYLDRIVAQSDATDLEKAVASACRQSTMPKLYPSSALLAHNVALQALAAGVGGPAGPALASLAEKALSGAYSVEDGRHMSTAWLQAVEAHGNSSERLLAQTAREATALRLYHSTAVTAQKKALRTLAGGVKGTDSQLLAQFGLDAMAGGYNQEDQRNLGYNVLESLQSTVLGSAARAATAPKLHHPSCVAVLKKALQMLAASASQDPDTSIAALGSEAIACAYNREDARTMGAAILGEFAKPGHGAVAQFLAGAANATAAQYLYPQSASGVMRLAFERIGRAPGSESAEVALSRLALESGSVAYNEKDRRTLGGGFLQELGARSTDPRVQALVRYAQGRTPSSDAEAVALQREVFEAIVAGRSSLLLKSGGYAISLPLVDPKGDPATVRPVLEESVAHNRSVVAQARAVEKEAASKLPGLQEEVARLSNRLAELQPALERHRGGLSAGWRAARMIGAISAGLGFLAAAGAGGPVAVGVTGAVVFGVTQWLELRGSAERRRLQDEASQATTRSLMKIAELTAERNRASSARDAILRAEEAIHEADKTLQVFRMVEPAPMGKLEVEEETVTIGGVRIARRAEAPPT